MIPPGRWALSIISTSTVPSPRTKSTGPIADYRYGGIFFSSDIVHTGIDIPAPTRYARPCGRQWAGRMGRLRALLRQTMTQMIPMGWQSPSAMILDIKGQRLYTVYAHMDEILVNEGQEVKTGDVLGLVGTTGLTTGPHLHFEVRMERNSYFTTYNPELWLAPPQGWGVLVGQLLNTNGSLLTGQDVTSATKKPGQKWVVRSYGNQAVNSDPYYEENLVLSDLPAGKYEIDHRLPGRDATHKRLKFILGP